MSGALVPLTSLTLCWQIERKDGAGLALTSHDRPLTVEGVSFEPAPAVTPAAVRAGTGLDPGSTEVAGVLSSSAISEADVLAGRWDGASVKLFAVDWERPGQPIVLVAGELGQLSSKDGRFEAELLGIAARLERPVCPLTSPECRAELGDPQCRVDMAGRRLRATAVAVAGHVVTLDRAVDDRFRFGEARFLSGTVNGERRRILAVAGSAISLRCALSGEAAPGTAIELVEGCDKRLATCAGRFGNAVNFRGEPHLPGNDLLTRYPGA